MLFVHSRLVAVFVVTIAGRVTHIVFATLGQAATIDLFIHSPLVAEQLLVEFSALRFVCNIIIIIITGTAITFTQSHPLLVAGHSLHDLTMCVYYASRFMGNSTNSNSRETKKFSSLPYHCHHVTSETATCDCFGPWHIVELRGRRPKDTCNLVIDNFVYQGLRR